MTRDRLARMRRPKVPGGYPHRTRVQLTDGELAALETRAAEVGVGLPEYLVERALSDEGASGPGERREAIRRLFALERQIAGVAVNVNQAARKANVGDGFPVVEGRAYLVEARELVGRIREAIDGLGFTRPAGGDPGHGQAG